MSVILSCDIHHQSLETGNQAHSRLRESECARQFLHMLHERQINATYFISGRALLEDLDDVRPFLNSSIEIGGHTFNCFEPSLIHRVSNKVFSSYPGPPWYEARDIRRTRNILTKYHHRVIRAWRNHMYLGGPNTPRLLLEHGFDILSDGAQKDAPPYRDEYGLFRFPINVIPDHEHIIHAERTPEWIAWWKKRYGFRDDWGSDSYPVEEWVDIAIADIKRNENAGTPSVILIHPITMYLADGFTAVRRILDCIAELETRTFSQVADELENMTFSERTK